MGIMVVFQCLCFFQFISSLFVLHHYFGFTQVLPFNGVLGLGFLSDSKSFAPACCLLIFQCCCWIVLLERFFTCCKGRSFQGTNCQHKHKVSFLAFSEKNMVGIFHPIEQRTNLHTCKTFAEYLRNRWSSEDICYRVLGSKWEEEERKENWSSQSSGSSDVFS